MSAQLVMGSDKGSLCIIVEVIHNHVFVCIFDLPDVFQFDNGRVHGDLEIGVHELDFFRTDEELSIVERIRVVGVQHAQNKCWLDKTAHVEGCFLHLSHCLLFVPEIP